MPHFFISYAKKDTRNLALQLEAALNALPDVTAWVDKSLRAGRSWELQIQTEIDRCDYMLVLYSPDINRHKQGQAESYVLTEISYAKYTANKLIIPIMAQKTEAPMSLTMAHYIDFTLPNLVLDDLIGAICNESGVGTAFLPSAAPTPSTEQATQPNDGWTPQIPLFDTPQPISPQTQAELTDFTRRVAQAKQNREAPKPAQPLIWGVENILPQPFEWVYIPPGNVTIDHQTFSVDVFNIAKYPITNAQFEVFIQAEDGYRNLIWWDETADSREWRSKNDGVSLQANALGSDRPVEKVSWYEAVAFCNWLTQRFNAPAPNLPSMKISLPTEEQWLRAAQSDDGRSYPWGTEFDLTRCNTKLSNIGRTTPVTRYPQGASPYGVMDMSGNVWELCLKDRNYYTGIRGGSWKTDASRANLTYREDMSIGKRLETIGFRIVSMNS